MNLWYSWPAFCRLRTRHSDDSLRHTSAQVCLCRKTHQRKRTVALLSTLMHICTLCINNVPQKLDHSFQ